MTPLPPDALHSLTHNELCPSERKGWLFKKTRYNMTAITALCDGLNKSAVTKLECVPVLWLAFLHALVTCTWPALRFSTHSPMPMPSV